MTMAKPPTMINASTLAAEGIRPTNSIGMHLWFHVTVAHAMTLIEMVGGKLVEMMEKRWNKNDSNDLTDNIVINFDRRPYEEMETFLRVAFVLPTGSNVEEIRDRLRADPNVMTAEISSYVDQEPVIHRLLPEDIQFLEDPRRDRPYTVKLPLEEDNG